jgi:sulfur-oxidizing protein SoxZ
MNMAEAMKMRATMEGDAVDVKVLIQHPMDTGLMKDKKTGKLIPAHFINQVVATLNGKTVIHAQWGVGIAQNPFVGFKIKGGKPGDKVAVNAVDNLGTKFDGEVVVA